MLVDKAGTEKSHFATGPILRPAINGDEFNLNTATASVNELIEAAHANQPSPALSRCERLDLIWIDDVPRAKTACETIQAWPRTSKFN